MYQQHFIERILSTAPHRRLKCQYLEPSHYWPYSCRKHNSARNCCTKCKIFFLPLCNFPRNDIERMIKHNLSSDKPRRCYLPSDVLEADMGTRNIRLSSSVINISCDLNLVTCLDQILVAAHDYFDSAIVKAASKTFRIYDLLLLNCPNEFSWWLKNIKELHWYLIIVFFVTRYQLCCQRIFNVTVLVFEHASGKFWWQQKSKRKRVVSSRKHTVCKYRQLKLRFICVFGVLVMALVIACFLRPFDMLDSFKFYV